MEAFLAGFAKAALYHAGGVASPGPDFAIVLHQSVRRGRRAAVFTSMGIAAGIFVHVAYSLFLPDWLRREHPVVLGVVKYFCAAYLAWVGARMFMATLSAHTANAAFSPAAGDACATGAAALSPDSDFCAFRRGLFVNLLNPKVALFFLTGFTNPAIIAPACPLAHRAIYGCWMALATAVWFVCVSCFFSEPRVARVFARFAVWLDRVMGVALVALAVLLAVSSF